MELISWSSTNASISSCILLQCSMSSWKTWYVSSRFLSSSSLTFFVSVAAPLPKRAPWVLPRVDEPPACNPGAYAPEPIAAPNPVWGYRMMESAACEMWAHTLEDARHFMSEKVADAATFTL